VLSAGMSCCVGALASSARAWATKRAYSISSSLLSPSSSSRSPHIRSIPFRVFELLEPVKAHRLDDPTIDHDDARLVVGVRIEVLMDAVRRHVNEVALLPVETLGLGVPLELHHVLAVELHVPVQVVALALDNVDDLLRQVPVLAGRLTGRQELHVDVEAALLGVHLLVDDVL